MGTLERRDRAKLAMLIICMIAVPVAISYAYANINGWNSTTIVDYNTYDMTEGSSYVPFWRIVNSTTGYNEAQTQVITNTTYNSAVLSLEHDDYATIGTMTSSYIKFKINMTFGADVTFSAIVMTWNYVGSGNVTKLSIDQALPSSKVFSSSAVTNPTWDPPEANGTYTFVPEAFEAAQIKVATIFYFGVFFDDADNLPSLGDYIDVSMKFYTSTAILTQTQLLQGLALCGTAIFIISAAAISPLWNPNTGYRRK